MVSIVRFYCTSTGPIGGLNCEVLLYFNCVGLMNDKCDGGTQTSHAGSGRVNMGIEQQ